ncbi:MAG: proteinMgtE intracellular protein [Ilumatobacteraceae bacterium]|jgi:CBS domain-containing protein|nr:proteinMgtE intracellular protein [Ilumatobacteraceae bacterium]
MVVRTFLRAARGRASRRGSRRPERRVVRRSIHAGLMSSLISVAGLIGRSVRDQHGAEVGRVRDVVIRWEDATYPAVSGLVVAVGRRSAFVAGASIESITAAGVRLRSTKVDLRDFVPREGEVALARHVIDHQLVDVDGVRVVRASDLYLAPLGDAVRLVGVDVGMQTLVRRLGPARLRSIPTPTRVIDWAAIQPLRTPGASVRLADAHVGLRRLRPAELAGLLEDLGRSQRQGLLDALHPEQAAEALEELNDDDRELLLRELPVRQAADLLAGMAPDEAADILRDLDREDRDALLAALQPETADELSMLLSFHEDTAGAAMTTVLVLVAPSQTVHDAVVALRAIAEDRNDVDGVLVVDAEGRLIDDISLFELLTAPADIAIGELIAAPLPVTVRPDDSLATAVRSLVDNRGSSIVVVDQDRRPVGRILADDVIDALLDDHRLPQVVRAIS